MTQWVSQMAQHDPGLLNDSSLTLAPWSSKSNSRNDASKVFMFSLKLPKPSAEYTESVSQF